MSCSNVTCLSAKVWAQYNETNSKFADIIGDQGSSTHKEKERWGPLVLTSKPDQMLSARRTCSSEYLKAEAAPRADFVQARGKAVLWPGHLPARQNIDNPPGDHYR